MAYLSLGSSQKERIRLPYAATELSAELSLSNSLDTHAERGCHIGALRAQFRLKPRIEMISLISKRLRNSSST